MAKKTKDSESTQKEQKVTKSKAKSTTKKTTTSKKATATKKITDAQKNTTSKKSSARKKVDTSLTTKKDKATSTDKKSSVVKKAESAKKSTTTKKKTATVKRTKKAEVNKFKSEYYDLPYMYNKTVVKVLAQTPKMLFIYWEISESDRKRFKKQYGDNFFENTRPVLIIFNDTLHYSFEVAINDFANSWYLHINDANCEYHVELGRRPVEYNPFADTQSYIPYYVFLTSSNEMSSPNNHILFNPAITTVKFRNVKTGKVTDKDVKQFTFITNFGIFTLQDLYKNLYPNESFEYENIVLGNTSSGALSSSGMFSSQFK